MTPWVEWDWPPEPPHSSKRIKRVEILPPQHPRVDVFVRHRHEPPPIGLIVLLCGVAMLIFAWRPLLLLVAIVTATAPQVFGVALLVAVVLTAVAIRDRRRGRPF